MHGEGSFFSGAGLREDSFNRDALIRESIFKRRCRHGEREGSVNRGVGKREGSGFYGGCILFIGVL